MKHSKVLFLSKLWQPDHPMLLRWKNYYESRGVEFIQMNINWNLYYPDRKRKLKKIISVLFFLLKNRIFLIHANDLDSARMSVRLKKIVGLSFVFSANEIFSHEFPVTNGYEFYKERKLEAEQMSLNLADLVFVPNKQRIDFFKRIYPNQKKVNYSLLENKSLTFGNKPVKSMFTKILGKGKTLFYGGTFWFGRNQENFPDLACALKKENMKLVLSGAKNDYLENLLQNKETLFVGNIPVEEYNDFIRNIDVALAWYYPTTINDELCAPLKIFDYLYAGKPVLAAHLPYIQELSDRFPGTINLFEAGNWEECFVKVKEIIRDYDRYKAAVESIPKEQLTWEGQYNYIDDQLKKAGIQLCVA